jgi:AhpD family alkylhydroperoxidase
MARLASPDNPGVLARIAGWYARRRYGKEMASLEPYAYRPGLLAGYNALETAFDRSRRLDQRLKLLAEMKAATLAGCEWCIDFGSMLSHGGGVTEEQLRDLPRYRDSDQFSKLEKLVLDYAAAMSRTPVAVSDELFSRLREHLDEAQLVELTTAVALENYRARFNHALGVEPQGFSEGAFCAIPERPERERSGAPAGDSAGGW